MSEADEITGSENRLSKDEVDARLAYIEKWDCGQDEPDCGDDDCPRHGSTAEELAALQELEKAMNSSSLERLISEDSFQGYVQDERESEGGIPADLCYYIDWKSYAEDQQSEYAPVTFRGYTFYAE